MINADCVHGYALIIQYFPAGYVHHLVAGLLQGLSDERFWEGMKPDSGMGSEEQNFHRSSVDKYQFMLVPFFASPTAFLSRSISRIPLKFALALTMMFHSRHIDRSIARMILRFEASMRPNLG